MPQNQPSDALTFQFRYLCVLQRQHGDVLTLHSRFPCVPQEQPSDAQPGAATATLLPCDDTMPGAAATEARQTGNTQPDAAAVATLHRPIPCHAAASSPPSGGYPSFPVASAFCGIHLSSISQESCTSKALQPMLGCFCSSTESVLQQYARLLVSSAAIVEKLYQSMKCSDGIPSIWCTTTRLLRDLR